MSSSVLTSGYSLLVNSKIHQTFHLFVRMTFTFSFKGVSNHVHNYGTIPFSTKFKNDLVCQYFNFRWILCRLFQKPVVRTYLSKGGLLEVRDQMQCVVCT